MFYPIAKATGEALHYFDNSEIKAGFLLTLLGFFVKLETGHSFYCMAGKVQAKWMNGFIPGVQAIFRRRCDRGLTPAFNKIHISTPLPLPVIRLMVPP